VDILKQQKLLNSSFDVVKRRLHDIKMEHEELGKKVSAISLKNFYLGIENGDRTILEIFREHNERCKSLINIDFAPGTYERYKTCYHHVEKFLGFMYQKKDMPLNEMSPKICQRF